MSFPEYKQVIVIRKLPIRKGKMIAQGAHASITSFLDAKQDDQDHWLMSGQKKIVVWVEEEHELIELYQKAKRAKLAASIITDAGHTEFHGVPTKTSVCIGPAISEEVDKLTGGLPLL